MTTSAAAYSVEKERFKRAAEVCFRTVKAALDGFDPYVKCIKRSITTMPTIFRREVVDGVGVMGIFRC
jgi:hypothetical protein